MTISEKQIKDEEISEPMKRSNEVGKEFSAIKAQLNAFIEKHKEYASVIVFNKNKDNTLGICDKDTDMFCTIRLDLI